MNKRTKSDIIPDKLRAFCLLTYSMVYIEDNVLIMAELEVISEWPVGLDDDIENTPAPVQSGFDRSTLKDYVIKHSEDLKDFVLDKVLAA